MGRGAQARSRRRRLWRWLLAAPAVRGQNSAKMECFTTKWVQALCCAEQRPIHLLDDLAGCFQHGRTRELCCVKPLGVLIFTYPKVASRFLQGAFHRRGYARDRTARVHSTHSHMTAEYEFVRMRPPCLVVMVARNLYSRNPSHFFYNAVLEDWDLAQAKTAYANTVRHVEGRVEIPDQMYVGRWLTQSEFMNASAVEVRTAFFHANMEVSKHYLRDFFGAAGDVVGVDMLALAKRHPERSYVFANASELGCKCDVLLLSYEHIRTWPETLRRVHALDRVELSYEADAVHPGTRSWYGPSYVHFMDLLAYSEREAAAMCQTDTMRELPFYWGLCGPCSRGVCTGLLPGANGVEALPRPLLIGPQ
mmetsp:Transcript_62841/g.194555  ORF Transcript_62841/g.194555 Transcript_62841/m.194555 type:complete len:364 (-) Transcript_62841:28-1119(-)